MAHNLEVVRALLREYADELGIDLAFQGFDDGLAALPGKYAPPTGRLLIAWAGAEAVGTVDDLTCEMKTALCAPRRTRRSAGSSSG